MQRLANVLLLIFGVGAVRAQLLSGITNELTTAEDNDPEGSEKASSPSSSPEPSSTESFATSNPGKSGAIAAAMDPRVVDFSGRHFKFTGEAGSFYNVIQDSHHQVSMRLKIGVLSDHVGTYISEEAAPLQDGIGFAYLGHKIIVELLRDDTMAVSLDGERLTMGESESVQEHDLPLPQGELRLIWQLHHPNFGGNAISIQTDLLRFTVFLTEKGSPAKSGCPQPAFLNFDAELLYPPSHHMQGVVGEGYSRVLTGEAHTLPDDGTFHGKPCDYQLPHYFPEDGPAAHKVPSAGAYRRLLTPIQAQLAATADRMASGVMHITRHGSAPIVTHASFSSM